MDQSLGSLQQNLDGIKRIEQDLEYWSARDIMPLLGYAKWQKFQEVICRAKESCKNSDQSIKDHFTGAGKMIQTGNGARRSIDDVLLTRYACYLIAQNGDPRKAEIAAAQTYFATQTRRQELRDQYEQEERRLISREKLRVTESKIETTVHKHGLHSGIEFAVFKDNHIKALYGGISTKSLKKKRNIPNKRALADFDTNIELKAKDFALAMTDHNIKEHNIKGSYKLNEEVVKNSKATRKTLLSRGIKPENLNPEPDIKLIIEKHQQKIG